MAGLEIRFDPANKRRIKRLADLSIDKIEKLRADYAKDIFRNAVNGTPVDTGNAISNWVIGIGRPNAKVVNRKPSRPGRAGGASISRKQLNKIRKTTLAKDVIISNNLEYISVLNARTRWIQAAEMKATSKANRKGKL